MSDDRCTAMSGRFRCELLARHLGGHYSAEADSRPRLLDLFCGAGGAGMGYHRAGFDVVGVDINPQPRYPFEFHEDDALAFLAGLSPGDYDVIHASPPCQAYSVANHIHGRDDHPDLVGVVRNLLLIVGGVYIIENVPGAPLHRPVTVCGAALGLGVKRHRCFESNVLLLGTTCQRHSTDYLSVFGGGARRRAKQIGRTLKNGPIARKGTAPLHEGQAAMGIDWMTRAELSQAIPPAYTEYLGKQLLAALRAEGAA